MNRILLIPAFIVASLAFGSVTLAETPMGKGKGEESGHHHMMRDDDGHHGWRHGDRNDRPAWKETLTKAQKNKLAQMKVDFLKQKYPLKAKMRVIKIELAVLATADNPDQKAIDAKIDELLALKKQVMQLKYAHKIAVRKELTPEQRVKFDMHMLKKAKQGKRGGFHGGGHFGGHHQM